jgi:hypothetical protein
MAETGAVQLLVVLRCPAIGVTDFSDPEDESESEEDPGEEE